MGCPGEIINKILPLLQLPHSSPSFSLDHPQQDFRHAWRNLYPQADFTLTLIIAIVKIIVVLLIIIVEETIKKMEELALWHFPSIICAPLLPLQGVGVVAKLHKVNKNLKEKYSKQFKLKLLRKTPKRETTFLSNLTNNNKLNLKRKVVKYFHPPLSKQNVSSYTFVTSLIQFSFEGINLLCQGKVNDGTGWWMHCGKLKEVLTRPIIDCPSCLRHGNPRLPG